MHTSRGFTLVELVLVLVIVAVMAGMALPRLIGPSPFAARAAADELAAAVRYAQQLGMNHGSAARLRIDAGRFFLERQVGAGWDPMRLASGEDEGRFHTQVTVAPGALDLRFDRMGRPALAGVPLTVPLTVSISASGAGNAHVLCIHPETGYVQVRHGSIVCP